MLTIAAAEQCNEYRYITFYQAAQQAVWTLVTDLFLLHCFVYDLNVTGSGSKDGLKSSVNEP